MGNVCYKTCTVKKSLKYSPYDTVTLQSQSAVYSFDSLKDRYVKVETNSPFLSYPCD